MLKLELFWPLGTGDDDEQLEYALAEQWTDKMDAVLLLSKA